MKPTAGMIVGAAWVLAAGAGDGRSQFEDMAPLDDCGPVALFVVCHVLGVDVTLAELRTRCLSPEGGSSVALLCAAAREKGLTPVAYRAGLEYLRTVKGPAIIDCPSGHFAVLLGWERGRAILFDPARGKRIVSKSELAKEWDGHVVVFDRGG